MKSDIKNPKAFKKNITNKYKYLKTINTDFSPTLGGISFLIKEIEEVDPNEVLISAYYREDLSVFEA